MNKCENQLIHHRIEQQAKTNPKSIALEFESRKLTYEELNKRANQLAHNLIKLGVKPEAKVAIYLERSLDMVITVLAVLKAGAAYVPIVSNYPQERISFILCQAQIFLVVTKKSDLGEISFSQQQVLFLDQDELLISKESVINPSVKVEKENIAYCIYTSGSTGLPKGVLVQHNNLSNIVTSLIKAYHIKPTDKILQFASLSFDAACSEIFTSLVSGATLCLAKQETLLSADALLETLEKNQITNVTLPPSVLSVLPEKELPSLKVIISAGEACNSKVLKHWAKNRKFFNGYGPTETTVCATVSDCLENKEITIGYPIDGAEVYILSDQLEKVQVGEIGEIYISGEGISRGYLNDPDLTAEKFIPNPFSLQAGTRLYKTGDLARYKQNQEIEFLGRFDGLVKLRGFRIEIGEIEATLSKHPYVQNVIVTVKENSLKDKTLVACWISKENHVVSSKELKEFLRQYLPEYMIPSNFLLFDKFPLTPNGKVDRKAIMAFAEVKQSNQELIFSSNETEEKLENIWSEVLRIKPIGTNQDFFELGGHSLLITQVLLRIKNSFNVDLPFRTLFDYPTISTIAKKIDATSVREYKEKDLVFLKKTIFEKGYPPLSFSQNRVWFIQQLDPTNTAYNAQATLHFYGTLDVEILEKCFNELVLRHEIFRTSFPVIEQTPVQLVNPFKKIKIPVIELQFLPLEERSKQVEELIHKEIRHTFDVTKLYLIRWTLLKLSEREHILIHVEHHLLHDGWSFNNLLKEFVELYNGFVNKEPTSLLPLPMQFSEFASYQSEWLKTNEASRQISYWRKQLKECPAKLLLNYDNPRPPTQTFNGNALRTEIPLDIAQKLRKFSQKENVTLFMTMFSAMSVLLYRYSNQEDICIGSGIANRRWDKVEQLIGMMINTVVLRVKLSKKLSFAELLKQVREITLDAYDNQDIPFDKVVEVVNPERDISYSPIYQVLFSFHDAPLPKLNLENLEIKLEVALNNGSSKFDINVVVIPHLEQVVGLDKEVESFGMTLIWEYNTDLFNRSTVQRMLNSYLLLLKAVVINGNEPISQLQIISKSEREQIITNWNKTKTEYAQDFFIHNLFELQAEKNPHSIAIAFKESTFTYKELNSKANYLAKKLVELGASSETLIGLCLERSPSLVVAVLAVFKAGAAYVPLDPVYPKDRLMFMVQDSKVKVLITHKDLESVITISDVTTLLIDQIGALPNTNGKDFSNLSIKPRVDNLAYVIYTSGSTGLPKGIAITHKSLMNFLYSMQEKISVNRQDIFLLVTSLSFDIAALELYLPLIIGAKLVIASSQMVVDGNLLLEEIEEKDVSIVQATPTTWQLLINTGLQKKNAVKILCGGETMPNKLAQKLCGLSRFVWNVYGPTETTIWSSIAQLEPEKKVTIGKPIANTQLYVLDWDLQPLPIGVSGNLYIGGDGLARGYLNKPELTAEKFVPNPFSDFPGSRLYKTGDIARYLPNGDIEFLGRDDNQIKLRGFRIELNEIETLLGSHPEVKQVVVLVKANEFGGELIAYLTLKNDISIESLIKYLKEKLPRHMLPSSYVLLKHFPLTPNGKIDRKALPEPDKKIEKAKIEKIERNPIEEIVTGIWSKILKIENIGLEENFFELGGHSLLAIKVVLEIQKIFNVEVSIKDIFEFPTIASLSQKVEVICDNTNSNLLVEIKPTSRDQPLELSFSQQRLWFLNQFEPNSSVYNIPKAAKLIGELNIVALEKSINEIIKRHEILRTRFTNISEQIVQVIVPNLEINLQVLNLKDTLPSQKYDKALEIMIKESNKPFNLSVLPLLRVLLIELAEKEHILFLNIHHIISDASSFTIFWKELHTHYQTFILAKESQLKPLPIQYVDYCRWQKNTFTQEILEKSFSYWKNKLAGTNSLAIFPSDKPRPAVQTYSSGTQNFKLSTLLTEQLIALSRKQHTTLFVTLLTSFKILFYRYSGLQDIVVGIPVVGRNNSQLENLIGCFVNTLVLRTILEPKETFLETLEKVKRSCLEAYAHQGFPFEKLVELLKIERSLSHSPIFQVMFNFIDFPNTLPKLQDLSFEFLDIETNISKFDLTLTFIKTEIGLIGTLRYNTDLFESTTAERIIKHLTMLLESAASNSQKLIAYLPLLTKVEEQEILVSFNNTKKQYENLCVHQLFERQVELTPTAVAVTFQEQKMTYQELNEKANQLANYLIELGVKNEVPVGIYTDICLEMMISILAILKAGGVYLPLELSYPFEHNRFILENSSAKVVLTQKALAKNLSQCQLKLVFIDLDFISKNFTNKQTPNVVVDKDNLCYIIYTSGSTGRPKGVMIEHKSLVNYLYWVDKELFSKDINVIPVVTKLSYDGCVRQIFSPLLRGKSVRFLSNDIVLDINKLAELLSEEENTALSCVPSLWKAILDTIKHSKRAKLQGKLTKVFLGGEALTKNLVEESFSLLPNIELWNLYGPTEVTVNACGGTLLPENNINIGFPLSNTQIYILDANLQPVPIGVKGQLYVGGIGVARGYLQNPQLTAERFIPNPFSHKAGERLYFTGDLARYLPNGAIEFLGRIDNQVKIRGYRIELGEIEFVLSQCKTVKQAVVLVKGEEENKYLVAYLVVEPQQELTVSEIRSYLKERLPDYMIPSFYVLIKEMPLTISGKIDRKVLPELNKKIEKAKIEKVERNPIEEIVTGIWSKILKIENVGLEENFFELGGHSLLAIRVVLEIQKIFNVEVSIKDIFEFPTIMNLSEKITMRLKIFGQGIKIKKIERQDENQQFSIEGQTREKDIPLSYAQERLWFLNQLEPTSMVYNMARVFVLKGKLNVSVLRESINEIVKRHEILRTNFVVKQEVPTQIIAPYLNIGLLVVQIEALSKEEKQTKALKYIEQSRKPFNLFSDPLLRVMLVKIEEQEHMLALEMHHIISDGWSIGLFQEELESFYKSKMNQENVKLPNLDFQYANYVYWQRETMKSKVIIEQIEYWKNKLKGMPQLLDLPTDKPRPEIQSYRGEYQDFVASEKLTKELVKLSHQENVTLFMTLLTAINVMLMSYTKKEDIVVGIDIANRKYGTEKLIGLFVNQLVIRLDVGNNPSFIELLRRVRQVALEAYFNQDVPFNKLVEVINPIRNASYNPLFQVMVVFQGVASPKIGFEGLKITSLPMKNYTSPFDMSIHLWQDEEVIKGVFIYNPDLFDTSTVTGMIDYYNSLLNCVISDANKPIWLISKLVEESLKKQHLEKYSFQHKSNLDKLKGLKPRKQ